MLFATLFITNSVKADHGVFNPKTFTLSNGLQVVVIPNHRMPVVSHMLWYKAGSADELPGKSGVAHFLEHLMFKGSKKFPLGKFSKFVARVGGSENAFTSLDYTGYYQNVSVDYLENMMAMEADRMKNLLLDPKEIETERLVVLEERAQRTSNNPASILREHAIAAIYMNHPYRRPVIGWEHEILNLTIDDIRAFYKKWYSPSNAILVVAGDVTMEHVKKLSEKTYGKIPSSPAIKRKRPSEPLQKANRKVVLKDARVRQETWSRSYLAPSRTTSIVDGGSKEQSYALEVLANVIGYGATSRIYRSMVVKQKLAISAGVSYMPSALGPSRFIFYASPAPGVNIQTIEQSMENEIESLLNVGVNAREVARVKKSMLAQAIYARDSLTAGALSIGSAITSGEKVRDVESWPHRISAVTVDQVNSAASAVIKKRPNVTAVLLGQDLK